MMIGGRGASTIDPQMATQTERDAGLLRLLSEADRQSLEAEVDEFIRKEIRDPTSTSLADAGRLFDMRAAELAPEDAIVARWFAAILRARSTNLNEQ
jgi:hypothetical protein